MNQLTVEQMSALALERIAEALERIAQELGGIGAMASDEELARRVERAQRERARR